MKKILFFISLLCINFGCNNKPEFQALELHIHFEYVVSNDYELISRDNKIRILNYKDYKIYVTPLVIQNSTEVTENEAGEVEINSSTIAGGDTTYHVYVVKNLHDFGLEYTVVDYASKLGIKKNLDSFLMIKGIDKQSFSAFDNEIGNLVNVIKDGSKKREVFAVEKNQMADPDSIYRDYDGGLMGIDFSFSIKKDSLHQSKLTKSTFIFNEIPEDLNTFMKKIPKRVISFEIRKIELNEKDIQTYLSIIDKFEKDLQSVKPN